MSCIRFVNVYMPILSNIDSNQLFIFTSVLQYLCNNEKEGEISMSNTTAFADVKKQYLKVLKQYVPIVDRVHGSNHPEFHEVRRVFETMVKNIEQAGTKYPSLQEEFAMLRTITHDYRVPQDVCESYEAVLFMLSKLDEAYRSYWKQGGPSAEVHTKQ
ncbi:hypothetical protein SpiBuddy_2570 [Sphaerochaeta globosa str. Buddy]|uniref:Iron-sulfur cluster repair di-iron protein, ric n=2 Tax=Sphaerochaeta TaxID=399320 RepID=F0RT76_SPHGB|nr:hypothetical protein SpiBuddy_2570 [Sphaerochaeta globosa str. Buddy]